eukprot:m.17193 g.17193  ORF g.17193 m.17193 type:complete len:77 (-) comp5147_c0_seq2:1734-1964(-)
MHLGRRARDVGWCQPGHIVTTLSLFLSDAPLLTQTSCVESVTCFNFLVWNLKCAVRENVWRAASGGCSCGGVNACD